MALNPSRFNKINVTDTCSVWNILSSRILYTAALNENCNFCITRFVHYECLIKRRTEITTADTELQLRLKKEIRNKKIISYNLDIEDLQEIGILEKRKNLGKGELSTIAFAQKIRQSIITDDQKARILAEEVLPNGYVQTTPLLLGWLFFIGKLSDHQKDEILEEHIKLHRPLAKYFNIMYEKALEHRLISN